MTADALVRMDPADFVPSEPIPPATWFVQSHCRPSPALSRVSRSSSQWSRTSRILLQPVRKLLATFIPREALAEWSALSSALSWKTGALRLQEMNRSGERPAQHIPVLNPIPNVWRSHLLTNQRDRRESRERSRAMTLFPKRSIVPSTHRCTTNHKSAISLE